MISLKVEGLGKKYKIGHIKKNNIKDSFTHLSKKWNPFTKDNNITPNHKSSDSEFWALKDISFQVGIGEAVGIIGRNGAGKSTLLKILSRITKPTTGRFEILGKVSSLLEVGTGFHQELTGRENIFLNGTILGMSRSEIKNKFDDIVFFSGVEKFIDTPVKHFSSGMKVRLAFSVAAHLDPNVLIIDEVLAVGDSAFQQKCIEKMNSIVKSGKTVLFVSHNMEVINTFCSKAFLLNNGKIEMSGEANKVITHYLDSQNLSQKSLELLDSSREGGSKLELSFSKIKMNKDKYKAGDELLIEITCEKKTGIFKDLVIGVAILNHMGSTIYHLCNLFINKKVDQSANKVIYVFEIREINLKPGKYTTTLFLKANEEIQDWIKNANSFIVEDSNIYDFGNSKMIQGSVQPNFSFYERL